MFIAVFLMFEALVILEGLLAYRDKFFHLGQVVDRNGKRVAVFVQHGGMWGDFLIVSPLLAYAVSVGYRYWSMNAIDVSLVVALSVSVLMLSQWAAGSKTLDESLARDGKITLPGWLHAIYMILALAIIMLFYWATPKAAVSSQARAIFSLCLMAHVVLGVAQPDWITNRSVGKISYLTILVCWVMIAVSWIH